jgi:hypothetical protein
MKHTTNHLSLALLSVTMVRAWLPSKMTPACIAPFRAPTVTTSDSSSSTTNAPLKLSFDITESAPPAVVITPFVKPDRIVLDNTLYVYDHCPFCVRVRVALGIKNVKHNLHFLANDDVATPTSLVGKKVAPIFVSIVMDDPNRRLTHLLCYWIGNEQAALSHLIRLDLLFLGIPRSRYCHGRIDGHY